MSRRRQMIVVADALLPDEEPQHSEENVETAVAAFLTETFGAGCKPNVRALWCAYTEEDPNAA